MSDQTEAEKARVKLRTNGDLTILEDDKPTIIGHYDRKTGTLEFISRKYKETLYNQVVDRIGTTNNGTEPSNLIIRNITVKGEGSTLAKNAPKRPKMGPLGDSALDVVEWYLTYDLAQAITRYGIYCDDKGNPIRKNCRRKYNNIVDSRDLDDRQLQAFKVGADSEVKGPVMGEAVVEDFPNAVIAKRATQGTFTPNEVTGGFQPDDDFEDAALSTEEAE